MLKILNILLLAGFVAVDIVAAYWIGQQSYSWLPQQATAEAKRVDDLFSFLVTIGAFIFLGIVSFIGYSILTCRAPKGDFSDARPDRGNPLLEVLWTGLPVLLVLWIAEPAYAATTGNDSKPETVGNQNRPVAEEIEVVAKQWSWFFRYPQRHVTSTELHLKVNQSVRLALRSEDVLHGFYVPEFRLKQDIIPNRTINFVLTPLRQGKYRLKDSQFSGTYFAVTEADVYVDSPAAYTQWLTQASRRTPAPANNLAVAEHARKLEKSVKSSWPTIAPAPPPVVNHSS